MRRVPWVLAFGFGLLHGLGFAGALAEIGLPVGEIPLALLSFNLWSDVLFFGLNIFDLLDTFTAKILLPLTGLGAIIFVAWCLERKGVEQELALSATGTNVWNIVARFVAPIGVIVVFLAGIL